MDGGGIGSGYKIYARDVYSVRGQREMRLSLREGKIKDESLGAA